MSRSPEIIWAQRSDKLFLTIHLPDAKGVSVTLQPDDTFNFQARADDHTYQAKLELYGKVNVERISSGSRSILCILVKEEKGWWKRLLKSQGKPPAFIKVDWNKWVDEDEEADSKLDSFDLGALNDMSDVKLTGGDTGGGDGDAEDDGMLYIPELEKES